MRTLPNIACTFLVGSTLLLAASCSKNNDTTPTDTTADEGITTEATQASTTTEDIATMQDEALSTSQLASYRNAGTTYPIVTVQARNTTNADTLTIDFGPSNYLCADQRTRRGKLLLLYHNPLSSTTTSYTATPTSYFVNDNQVAGSVTGTRTTGAYTWTMAANLTLTLAAGGTITYQSTTTRTQVEGTSTAAISDDVFLTAGSATATGTLDVAYALLATDLRRAVSCHQLVSGTLILTRTADSQRGVKVDFGTGTCDELAQATLIPSGRVLRLTLR